jgi:hypothetical protein
VVKKYLAIQRKVPRFRTGNPVLGFGL